MKEDDFVKTIEQERAEGERVEAFSPVVGIGTPPPPHPQASVPPFGSGGGGGGQNNLGGGGGGAPRTPGGAMWNG
jgi:hypothetical protein